MSTRNYRSPTAETGQDTGTKEQAKQTAGTAAEQGRHVADVAKDEARQVTSEAKHQARNLVGEVRTQVEDQSRTQRDRLVSTLRTFGDDLEQMSSKSEPGMASDLVRQGAERVRNFTDNMAGREPSELLDEVRNFARRRPGTFLLGALVAGMVAGRLARGARDADNGSGAGTTAYDDLRAQGGSPATSGYPTGARVGAAGVGTGSSGVSPASRPGASVESGYGVRPSDPLGDPMQGTGSRSGTGDPLGGRDPLATEDPLRAGDRPWSEDPLRGDDPLRSEDQPRSSDDPTRRGPA